MGLVPKVCMVLAGMGLTAQGVSAQNLRDLQMAGQSDTRATASVTIPLGARVGSRQSKPRIDLALASQQVGHSQGVLPLRTEPKFRRPTLNAAKLSFTLEQNPRLLLNDQRIATFGPRVTANESEKKDGGGIGTAGWIVLGAGALVGASFLFADALEDDLEEAFGIDD